jgi:hypothetical protein
MWQDVLAIRRGDVCDWSGVAARSQCSTIRGRHPSSLSNGKPNLADARHANGRRGS